MDDRRKWPEFEELEQRGPSAGYDAMKQYLGKLSQLGSATEKHVYLQGLRFHPFGLLILFDAGRQADWWPGNVWLELAVAGLWSIGIHKFYAEHYGVPTQDWSTRESTYGGAIWSALLAVAGLLGMLIPAIIAVAADIFIGLPFSAIGILLAVGLGLWWRMGGGSWLRAHYIVVAGIVLVISLLPLFGLYSPQVFVEPMALPTALGLISVVGGTIDHALLSRYYKAA